MGTVKRQIKRAPLMRYPQVIPDTLRGGAVTIGNFDGVHRGHERVLKQLKAVAGDKPAVVITFYPHPIRVLRPDARLRYLSSIREKAERLGELGVDLVYFIHFSSAVAKIGADDFIQRVLVESLGARDLVVGEDVAIGKGREGNWEFLKERLPKYNISLHQVPRLEIDGVKAGSRKIRELIESGEVKAAADLIGSPFTISARVGHGDKRGSAIGFPTANVAIGNRLIPLGGVYACSVLVAGEAFNAVVNIGTRPTFSGMDKRLEAHILNFPARSLYGKRIHVAFMERLREERRFGSVAELSAQIKKDIEAARVILGAKDV
jgi:riboflavin kinase/FMN adenylyltransferase